MAAADIRSGYLARAVLAMLWALLSPHLCQGEIPVLLDYSTALRYSSVKNGHTVIHLPKGSYLLRETLRLPSHTTLEGEGSGTLLRAASPFAGERFITNEEKEQGSSDIVVTSLAVSYRLQGFHGLSPGILRFEKVTGLRVVDLTMEIDSPLYGIDLASAVRDAVVAGCSVTNRGGGGGIMVRNRDPLHPSSDITLRGNFVSSSAEDEPVALFGWMGRVERVLFTGNRIHATGASFGLSVFAVDQPEQTGLISRVRVVDNSVEGGRIGGITVKGGARDVEITGNRIHGADSDGIFIHSGGAKLPEPVKVTVSRNEIVRAGRHCIFASGIDLSILDNSISDCRESGVYLGGSVKVKGNTITRARPGILVDTDKSCLVEHNTLTDASGITVLGKGHVIKLDNTIR